MRVHTTPDHPEYPSEAKNVTPDPLEMPPELSPQPPALVWLCLCRRKLKVIPPVAMIINVELEQPSCRPHSSAFQKGFPSPRAPSGLARPPMAQLTICPTRH